MATATTIFGRRLAALNAELRAHRKLGTTPAPSRREDIEAELGEIFRGMEKIATKLGESGDELVSLIQRMKPVVRAFEVMHDRNGEHSRRVEP